MFYIDKLSDDELTELNELLPWKCFVLDSTGRQFGKAASSTKRTEPQEIPDPRITELNELIPLYDLSVLEVGCFEGVHTTALCSHTQHVIAVDSRIVNVVKTIVRCAMSGNYRPIVFKCDVEKDLNDDFWRYRDVDVVHHVGVLYHLTDPVTHLQRILKMASEAILLDTHYAEFNEATHHYYPFAELDTAFSYKPYNEQGHKDVFSGMSPQSKWLLLDDIVRLITEAGFELLVRRPRVERNGSRVTIIAKRVKS